MITSSVWMMLTFQRLSVPASENGKEKTTFSELEVCIKTIFLVGSGYIICDSWSCSFHHYPSIHNNKFPSCIHTYRKTTNSFGNMRNSELPILELPVTMNQLPAVRKPDNVCLRTHEVVLYSPWPMIYTLCWLKLKYL